jgi:hypothetical protein
MKLEDIFTTKITSEIVDTTYKGFPALIARELIEDLKEVYRSQALEKLKSILEGRYRDEMTCNYYDCGWCYAPNDIKTNATQGECTFPENCPYLKSQMTNQANCNHRTPPKHHVDYLDERMVIVNGVSYTRIEPTPIVIHEDENTIVVGGVKYQKVEKEPPKALFTELSRQLTQSHIGDDDMYDVCDIVRGWLIEHTVIETEDEEKVTFTIHKEQLQTPK